MFLLATGLSASFPGFPGYVSGLGAGLTMVGVMVSLLGLGNILADLPAGALIHRFGDRRLIIISSALASVAAFGIAASANLGVIGALRTVIGLSQAAMMMSMMAFVRNRVAAAARGRSLAFVGGAVRLGFFLGPVAGGLLAENLGMPTVFLLQGSLMVVSTLFLMSTGRDSTGSTGQAPVPPPAILSVGDRGSGVLRALLRSRGRDLSVVALVVFTLMFLRQARQIIFPLWGEHLGLSVSAIGAVMSASAAIELFLFIPAGWLMDHVGRRPTMAACVGTMAAGVAALPLTAGLSGYLAAALAIGIGNGFGSGIVMTFGTDFAPEGAVGPFLGVWRLFGDTGSMVGPLAVGALAAALTLPASLLAAGALGGLSALVMLVLGPETRTA